MDKESDPVVREHGVVTRKKKGGTVALVAILLIAVVIGIVALVYCLRHKPAPAGAGAATGSGAGSVADGSGSAAGCGGGSVYTAAIGHFRVAVADPNVIIRQLDANFEGGPVTRLSVGQCIAGETNVVDAYPTKEVTILAHPSSNAAALRASFEAGWGSPLTAGGTQTVDGVTAQIYTGSGLFDTKLLYFDHGGIGYQIELPDVNPASEAIADDVLADWSFTP